MLAPYLTDFATGATFTQIDRRIESSQSVRTQFEARIDSGSKSVRTEIDQRIDSGLKAILSQVDRRIDTGSASVRTEIDRRIDTGSASILTQVDRRANGVLVPIPTQVDQKIGSSEAIPTQFEGRLEKTAQIRTQFDRKTDGDASIPTQFDRRVTDDSALLTQIDLEIADSQSVPTQITRYIDNGSKTTLSEFGRGPISHEQCGGYLFDPYLMMPYLSPEICAHMRTQFARTIRTTTAIPTQFDRSIVSSSSIRTQIERRVEATRAIHTQFLRTQTASINTQILYSIYNTTNLRILCDFPSRGTSGTNWSVIAGGTAPGDRGINNVNTDIVEQTYRSTTTSITIQCDTQISQGIFNDTLAILGHNFTTSASVTLQGSNDVTFSSVPFNEALTVELENLYWISEYLPLTSYRYWRLVISDVTNTDGFIEIGTVVFGSTIIFNGECFIDEVVRRKTHFADRVRTEGYSNVSNDRALKRAVSLTFRRLNYNRENYENLVGVIDTARTSLKCLWIPTPQFASRFAVFGKLAEIPVENHKAISRDADYIDLDINVDEAL